MKVVTYNIHQGRGRGGRPSLVDIGDALATLDADVIACQEVLGAAPGGRDHQAAWLGERLGMQVRFAANAVTRHGALGNATLSRSVITADDNLDLSVGGFEPRGALRTTLDTGVRVWNTHLGLTRGQLVTQWRRIVTELAGGEGGVVVCGDFNDWRGVLQRSAASADLRSTLASARRRHRATFPAHRPWFGLDRLYYRGLRLVGSAVLRNAPWSELSDHLPVEATFAPAVGVDGGAERAWTG